MANASSRFLRGANTGGKATDVPPDEGTVLAAVGTTQATDLAELAEVLGVTVQAIKLSVEKMAMSGLLETSGSGFTLTEAGNRALRYASLAKY